ncbi:hypothetical protein RvY_04317 [Ramazzottius varieornatus]|uniref:Uncharacterized protein n=1 Tax=Ramazzottius varieornatus TaxID=947166 RepID=A0A1D1UUT0_RAMVA|nr:hypothetical protein RvY_04317 [Ramazzottius varieornatus]
MYSRGKAGQPVPSDAQAKEKLIVFVYEYLHHMGASQAAGMFLQEIKWSGPPVQPGADPPGFLSSWWSVFWDLYCAAPERRDREPHSREAASFHDYTIMAQAGHPLSPGMNGIGMPQNHLSHGMPDGAIQSPSLAHQLAASGEGGLPPGFFPGSHLRPSSAQMVPHGAMMHSLTGAGGQPSSMQQQQQHPGQPSTTQQQQAQQQSQQQTNGPLNPNSPHPAMTMMMQSGASPRGYAPSTRGSPAARMTHPSQQQVDFSGAPPGSMMIDSQGMLVSRMPMTRGMPASPMTPGAYPPSVLQRMQNPNGSPSSTGSVLMSTMQHQQQQRAQAWQHQNSMGHYSTPSPPNGSYMNMMGPPSHMQQSPSQESVLSGGSDNIYGMMKAQQDRYGNSMQDGSMASMQGVDMGSINGEGLEMKHSPSVNGSTNSSGTQQNTGQNSMENVDEYSLSQYSSGQTATSTGSTQDS